VLGQVVGAAALIVVEANPIVSNKDGRPAPFAVWPREWATMVRPSAS
jgi:hypothetical protein